MSYLYSNHNIEREPEYDREGRLDPAWERQQKKTFTAWCNSHLRRAGAQIETIEEDFRSGLMLMLLLEVISGEQLPKPDRGKMRFHRIANVNKALDFIESKGVKLVSIGAEEIVDGNLKMTLGMIWTIILRFAIQNIAVEDLTAKEGLLLWCQRKTAPYKNVKVQNFHTSFKDGLAFCALIHRHRPDLIDYSNLQKENMKENLNIAFTVAERRLDIPRMLDVDDMLQSNKCDEKSVMAYVSSYYHAFSGAQKAETAANRICKVLSINQENEKLMDEYERLSSSLLEWIAKMRPWLENRGKLTTLKFTQEKLEIFGEYRNVEKPPRLMEKSWLETTYNTLQTRLRLSNRPPYMPNEGKLINDIVNAWSFLENSEKGFEDWLLSELKRLERLEHLAKKLQHKCEVHKAWTEGKEDLMTKNDHTKCKLNEIKALRKRHEAFESDLSAHQDRVEQIAAIAEELNLLGYHEISSTNENCAKICEHWLRLCNLTQKYKTTLEEVEKILERIDILYLAFAKRAAPLNNWLDGTIEDLVDIFIVHSVDEIKFLMTSHELFKKTLPDAEVEIKNTCALMGEVSRICNEYHLSITYDNPYTAITSQDLNSKWSEILKLIPTREQNLSTELQRQITNDQLRKSFATDADEIMHWIEARLQQVGSLTNVPASLEQHQHHLISMEKEIVNYQGYLDKLEACNRSMQEAIVYENKYTRLSMETIRVAWEQLKTSIARNTNEIENQILLRDSRGLNDEQIEDFRRSFIHFDRNRNKSLEPNEFKACLVSLGYNIRDDKQGEHDFHKIMTAVDPNNHGYVTFEAFIDFMAREHTDADSLEQLIQSFRIIANDQPFITESALRQELPANQAEYCARRMKPFVGYGAPHGALDYTTFSAQLYGETNL